MKTIIATVHVQPGQEANFRLLAQPLKAETRAEPGNQQFNLYHDVDHPSDYLFTEVYSDQTAIETHRVTSYFQTFAADLVPIVNAPMDVMIFNGQGLTAEIDNNDEGENIMITINATVFVKEAEIENYLSLTQSLIAGTRAEDGNLRYDMYQSTERLGEFLFVEQYESQAALDAHHAAKHFTQFLESVDPLLNQSMKVAVFRELPGDE